MRGEGSCLVRALGNTSSILWLVCTFQGVRSLAVQLYYLECCSRSFFQLSRKMVTSADARGVCAHLAVSMPDLNVFTVVADA